LPNDGNRHTHVCGPAHHWSGLLLGGLSSRSVDQPQILGEIMFGLLNRKEMNAYLEAQVKQMETERWFLENEQDKLKAKIKDLQERVSILEDRHLGGLMTPKEVDEKMQKRIEANRYARSQYRKRKEKNASNRTPSI
jgi:hypothetical protein